MMHLQLCLGLIATAPGLAAAPWTAPSPPSSIEYGLQADPDPHPDYDGETFVVTDQASLNMANAQALPGDTIEFANGTYSSWIAWITANGSASHKIIVKARSPRGVTFTGDSQLILLGDHLWVEEFRFVGIVNHALIVRGSHGRVTRNYFSGNGTSGEETLRIEGSLTNLELDNNEITQSVRQSIIAYSPQPGDVTYLQPQNLDFHHNFIHDIPNPGVNGGEALTTIGGTNSPLENYQNRFEYNLIRDFDGDPEVLSIKNGGWIVRFNKIENAQGDLTLRGAHNCIVEGNWLVNSGAIRVAGTNHTIVNNHYDGVGPALWMHHGYDNQDGTPNYSAASDNLIAHNTFRTSGDRVVGMITKSAPLVFAGLSSDNTIVNNVFWRTQTGPWLGGGLWFDFLGANTWRHDLIWNDQLSYGSGVLPAGVAILNVDPQLAELGGLLEPMSCESPAVDAGEGGHTQIDVRGQARDGSVDYGAVEWSADAAAWSEQGSALAGVFGEPLLMGSGSLCAGGLASLDLAYAAPSALSALFLALSAAPVPFKGGTLMPFPFFEPLLTTSDTSGAIVLPFTLPAGVPGGTQLWVQWAILDPAAVAGVALSNAVKGVTP
jgi:poly(beta-D-mannuronate) lyase